MRLRIVLPPRGSPARLPYLLIPLLAAMAVVQLALPERIDLPPGGSVARTGLAPLPGAPPVVIAPPRLAARDLFAPAIRKGSPDAPADPLNGAVIAGVVQRGRLRLGVVQLANGRVRYVATGGAIEGWQLAALDQGEARLTRGGGQNLLVAYGSHASSTENLRKPPSGTPNVPEHFAKSPQNFESGQ